MFRKESVRLAALLLMVMVALVGLATIAHAETDVTGQQTQAMGDALTTSADLVLTEEVTVADAKPLAETPAATTAAGTEDVAKVASPPATSAPAPVPTQSETADEPAPQESEPVVVSPVEYEILFKYYDNTGEREHRVMVAEDGIITDPRLEPELDGYTFLFWYNPDQDFENDVIVEFEFDRAPVSNLVLRAFYVENETSGGDTVEEAQTPQEEQTQDPTASQEPIPAEQIADSGFITIIANPDEDKDGPAVLLDDEDEDGQTATIASIDDGEVPLAGPALMDECQIFLTSNHSSCINEGDMITVRATLVGYDPFIVDMQWFYDDGTGWQEAEGATGLSHSFTATSQSVNYNWRLEVTIMGYAN